MQAYQKRLTARMSSQFTMLDKINAVDHEITWKSLKTGDLLGIRLAFVKY